MPSITVAAEAAMHRHIAELSAIQQLSMPSSYQVDNKSGRGSVLAVVNFPASTGRDCNGIANFGKVYQLRLDYDDLVALGSTKIMAMLKPKKQERFRRLLKMDTLPDGIDYVLDFTPPLEGEECSELTASLWLPACTKVWWMAGHYKPSGLLVSSPRDNPLFTRELADKPVGPVLVLGHDDECTCYTTHSSASDLWATSDNVRGIYHGEWVPTYREQVKDYCRVRHCMNVIRILRAIAGEDLLVNSATRMWTLAHLALYLDVVPVVRDSITQWWSAPPNTKFIEIFPEESFKIALMLQMRDVLLASFKILVNERAVDHAATTPLTKPPAVTWMDRPRTEYGDLPEDPIEHASRAFADRMKAKLDLLRSGKAYELMAIGEWTKLQYYTKLISNTASAAVPPSPFLAGLLDDLTKLKDALLTFLPHHVKHCLLLPPPVRLQSRIVAQRAHYCGEDKQLPLEYLLAPLNDYQRACLPFFWANLKEELADYGKFKYRTFKAEYLTNIASDFNDHLQEALGRNYLKINFHDFTELLGSNYAFDEKLFHLQLEVQISMLSTQATFLQDFETTSIQFLMSDHLLLTLEESETKYLPLWAGGFDDGSGGVFQDEVPPADMGPSEPGPHYHTGHTIASNTDADGSSTSSYSTVGYAPAPSSTASFSDLGVGGLDLEDCTTARSLAAHGGSVSTATLDGRSGVVSVASEAFTAGSAEDDMREAMYAVPAEHQALGQAVGHYVEGVSDDGRAGETETETEVGDEEGEEDDDVAMDSDSTLSLGSGSDDDDFMMT